MKPFHLQRRLFALFLPCVLLWSTPSHADERAEVTVGAPEAPKVVVSIKPLHSLVASVMDGVGKPALLVKGNASPHTFSLKPSSARLLQEADLVFWVGSDLEQFLTRPLASLAAGAIRIALGDLKEEESEEGGSSSEDHEHHDEAHQHAADAHVWLNPDRAMLMLGAIAEQLITLDPVHAQSYKDNAKVASDRILGLSLEIEQHLEPWLDVSYIVFHDAYGAFEERFSITGAIPFLLNPESGSGADRIQRMRTAIKREGAVCLFVEPQFGSAIVDVIGEGTNIRRGVLDPLGGELEEGPDLYYDLLSNLADELVRCLGES